jgi:hypothetical protein
MMPALFGIPMSTRDTSRIVTSPRRTSEYFRGSQATDRVETANARTPSTVIPTESALSPNVSLNGVPVGH